MKRTILKLFKRHVVPVFLLVVFMSMNSYGQSTITGTITSSDDGTPVPGVNVVVKGTSNGTSTDFDGNYAINASSNDVLVFSYLGFKTIERSVGGQSVIDIVMQVDNEQLDEVVVIGYGTQKKSDLTGAISSVSSKDFEKQPLIRVEDALQSRAAGVSVSKTTGAPGGQVKIRIRGSNSISFSNQPLIVIDGILGGTLESLNPNDIATMDILKDASASAIYGSRGANGVVVITTKKGSGKPKIGVEYFTTISNIPKKISLLSPEQYAELSGTEVVNGGTDYQDEYFKTALLSNVQLTASGKEGNLSYFISGNYVDQEGVVFNSDYNRFSLRANLNAKFGEKLNVGLNLFGSRELNHNLFNGGARSSSDARGGVAGILTWDPTIPIRNPDGTYYQLQSSFGNILVNPIAVQSERDNNRIQDRFNANLNISYDISKTLNFTILGGSLFRHTNDENFAGIPAGTTVLEAQAGFSSSRLTTYQLSNILSWNKTFGKTNVKLTGVYELQGNQTKTSSGSSGEFGIGGLRDAFYLLELGVDQGVRANQTEGTIQSYVGRAEFNYGEDFYLTGTIRVDQSSNFRKDNRTGYFPSVSAAYNVSKLLPEEGFFNSIKLRAGYGEVGNQNVGALATYPDLPTGRDFAFDGSTPEIGIGNPTLKDENLKWETTKQINAGLDFSFLNNSVQFTVDWYKKNTTDLLLRQPVPDYNGGGTVLKNIGEVQNTGFDFTLNTYPITTEDFSWNANFNLSTVANEIVDLGGPEQILTGAGGVNPGGSTSSFYSLRVGEPLGQFHGATFLGTWKTADAAANGDIVAGTPRYLLDEEGEILLSDIGNGTPSLTWGLNNTITYKNIDLNFVLRGVHDYQVYNVIYAQLMAPTGAGLGRHSDYINRWTPENETDIPTGGDLLNSSRFVEDGDFIRLSNLSLGYTFKDIKFISSFKLYVSGQNLFTISDYRGFDPEVSSTGVSNNDGAPSFDFGAIPNPRSYTIGARIQF